VSSITIALVRLFIAARMHWNIASSRRGTSKRKLPSR
jgi:hypothetical protein